MHPRAEPVTPTISARPPRRRDAVANREALLSAAQSVLASDSHASLDAIAQAAGPSRRALYGHFPDRDSLVRDVIAVGAARFNSIAEMTDDADPRVALAQMAVRLWREATAVRAAASIALDDAHVGDTVRALAPLRRRVRELTRAGVESGAFRTDQPLRIVHVWDGKSEEGRRLHSAVVDQAVEQAHRAAPGVDVVPVLTAGAPAPVLSDSPATPHSSSSEGTTAGCG